MGEPAFKLPFNKEEKDENKPIKSRIIETHTEEIIIGLCAPIGTDVHYVADEIGSVIREKYGYNYEVIRLSNFIAENAEEDISQLEGINKFNKLIELGNKLREEKGETILAELAVSKIALNRERLKPEGSNKYKSERICYIIDSIKHIEELQLFRLIYGDLFYFFGAFSIPELRVKNLELKGLKTEEVYQLMRRDSGEEIQFGQKVSETFVQADFFLRIDESTASIPIRIARYLSLIFASDIVTPTTHETAMYMAAAAAGNSACLSRQVGASITDREGEILSVGWNDVPKVNGGVYQSGEEKPDHRCVNMGGGKCFNDEEKVIIRDQLIDELIENGVIQSNNRDKAVGIVKNSRIKELIEFSRAVHAEMLAIIHGCQKCGERVKNGRIYTTTYPCHNCARHIVAAGIKEIYYIEPYRKSLATKLHNDSITEDESNKEKVRILMYDGVSPRRYLDFFKSTAPRKQDGKIKKHDKKVIMPKSTLSLEAIPVLEKEVIESLREKKLIAINHEEDNDQP
jgi:deoxycytidylate deaminase